MPYDLMESGGQTDTPLQWKQIIPEEPTEGTRSKPYSPESVVQLMAMREATSAHNTA